MSPESGFRAWAPQDPLLARRQERHRLALVTVGGWVDPGGSEEPTSTLPPSPTTAGPAPRLRDLWVRLLPACLGLG